MAPSAVSDMRSSAAPAPSGSIWSARTNSSRPSRPVTLRRETRRHGSELNRAISRSNFGQWRCQERGRDRSQPNLARRRLTAPSGDAQPQRSLRDFDPVQLSKANTPADPGKIVDRDFVSWPQVTATARIGRPAPAAMAERHLRAPAPGTFFP